jgi:hypothetical protein
MVREAKLATALPPSARLVHVHRQKVYKWAKVFAITVVILGILAIALPGNGPYAIYAVGSIVLLLGLVLLPVGYFNALQFDRSLVHLTGGQLPDHALLGSRSQGVALGCDIAPRLGLELTGGVDPRRAPSLP